MTDTLGFHEIIDIQDDLLLPWLDLYEQAFPANEKVLVSDHLRILKKRAEGSAEDQHLLAALDKEGALVGMARYEIDRQQQVGYLVYLAVQAAQRNLGFGKSFYAEIVARIQAQPGPIKALLLELERPDQVQGEAEKQLSERRIRFYERQGAFLLRGIEYVQKVDNQPPVLMHLMLHPFVSLTPDEAYHLVSQFFMISRSPDYLTDYLSENE